MRQIRFSIYFLLLILFIPIDLSHTVVPILQFQDLVENAVSRMSPAIQDLELKSLLPAMPFQDKDVNTVRFLLYSRQGSQSKKLSDSSSSQSEDNEDDFSHNGLKEDLLEVNDIRSFHLSEFDRSKPVKLLIHGWSQHVYSRDFPRPIRNAYLSGGLQNSSEPHFNVICVDWGALSREFLYFNSAVYAEKVGQRIGEFIVFMRLGGFIPDYSHVHMIGFSLGAQVAGIAGHFVKTSHNGQEKVGRITGLDPAGPGFDTSVPLSHRLDESDAFLVDVIHTNMGQFLRGEFGTPLNAGTVDFYPNGGHKQPSCQLSLFREYSVPRKSGCHHMKSIDYFEKSIYGAQYLGCLCMSWSAFKKGKCSCHFPHQRALMGERCCGPRSKGKFYLHLRQGR